MQSQPQQSISNRLYLSINSIREKSKENVRDELVALVNELINNDFNSLIQILYRIDVSEQKIRKYLNENEGNNAADLLADLIIERQLQKIKSRKMYGQNNNPDDQEERW